MLTHVAESSGELLDCFVQLNIFALRHGFPAVCVMPKQCNDLTAGRQAHSGRAPARGVRLQDLNAGGAWSLLHAYSCMAFPLCESYPSSGRAAGTNTDLILMLESDRPGDLGKLHQARHPYEGLGCGTRTEEGTGFDQAVS